MTSMPFIPVWQDLAIRLAVALLAGALLGLNRGESGKAAGLRTTMLVCLAACLAMLQMNVLLSQAGKPEGSFAVLDLMRLPLGILSGVGFIGAGAILRKDGLVTGLTTAATLWFVTVVGLCAGGGQIALAVIGIVLGMFVLSALAKIEHRLPRNLRASLTIRYDVACRERARWLDELERLHCRVASRGLRVDPASGVLEERFQVHWHAPERNDTVERAMAHMASTSVHPAEWSIDD
ncbi:putative Mg2+ transporter-C (MgtC) family protein [Paraburkholderia sp. GAS206C]|uniref:MgtC/SapB family protein n=1 Tax=unclassified Paraburkholderia TaxID=2615204 RepID=UPI003D1FF0D7